MTQINVSDQALLGALEENDEEAYTNALSSHESISRLDPWFIPCSVLRPIRIAISLLWCINPSRHEFIII